MLTEKRYEIILNLLEEKGTITVTEVKDLLNTSESTVRRDITALHQAGRLIKVFGGAVAEKHPHTSYEPTVAQKNEVNIQEKKKIAEYAAGLIVPNDFVYLDAGTSTGYMIDYIRETTATYVTNGVNHASKLSANGFKVLMIGGELKGTTEAVVGTQAMQTLQTYHFTKGFFGTNGATRAEGFTTPDANEALIKKTAMTQSETPYVLCDYSKFEHVSSVTFGAFQSANVITDRLIKGYEHYSNVIIAK